MKSTVLFASVLLVGAIDSTVVVANELFEIGTKDPSMTDLSVNKLIDYNCDRSSHFNTLACQENVNKCYKRYEFPKTITVDMKLDAMNECVRRYIR